MRIGERIDIVYQIVSDGPEGQVDLGAGFYDASGEDRSGAGRGDRSFVPVGSGTSTHSREFYIPSEEVYVGEEYELVGQVFPAGQAGEEGVDALGEDNCSDPDARIAIIG